MLYFVFSNVPPYSVALYWAGYPVIPALLVGLAYLVVPRHPPEPGKVDSIQGQEMLTLVKKVDTAAGQLRTRYRLKVLVEFNTVALILFGVVAYSTYVSLIGLAPLDRIAVGVSQLALVIAVGAFAFRYVKDFLVDSIREIAENEIFPKVVNGRYATKVYPVVRAVIRERIKLSKRLNLEDIYNIEPTLFEQRVLLEKLLE